MSIYKWAYEHIDADLNYVLDPESNKMTWLEPPIKIADALVMVDDKCKVPTPSFPATSVYPPGRRYVVWIIRCDVKHARTGRGHDHGYTCSMRSEDGSAGRHGWEATIEEARAWFDRVRGKATEQLSLL